jgi:hypothetical protein
MASGLFATWWYGLAGAALVSGTLNFMAAAGYTDLNLWLTFGLFSLLLICAALGGLLYYLIYLYTGSRKAIVPLALFYLGLYLALMYLVNLNTPTHVEVGRWTAQVKYDKEFDPLYGYLFIVLLLVPQLVAAVAYFSLYFRTGDRTQRYRIAMVSGSIIVWFGSSLLVGFLGGRDASQSDAWQVASRILSLMATLAILVAYRPPKVWRQRYGLRGVSDEESKEVSHGAHPAG